MGDGMTKQILLIEDEVNIAEAIRFILSRDGWQIDVLTDGAGAEAAIARLQPDMLILDLMLPGKTGLQILTELRANPAFAALPVLMLTAKGQGRDREAAERAGVSAFMTKPFDNSDIRAVVRGLLGC
jgi:DNA-binding response OmpR family regulator